MAKVNLNLMTDKIESHAWEIARAVGGGLSADETSDLHVMLLDFAKEIQRNAVYVSIGEVKNALARGLQE